MITHSRIPSGREGLAHGSDGRLQVRGGRSVASRGVGRDVRATQLELAPEARRVGTALGLSVLLPQSRVPGVGVIPFGRAQGTEAIYDG